MRAFFYIENNMNYQLKLNYIIITNYITTPLQKDSGSRFF